MPFQTVGQWLMTLICFTVSACLCNPWVTYPTDSFVAFQNNVICEKINTTWYNVLIYFFDCKFRCFNPKVLLVEAREVAGAELLSLPAHGRTLGSPDVSQATLIYYWWKGFRDLVYKLKSMGFLITSITIFQKYGGLTNKDRGLIEYKLVSQREIRIPAKQLDVLTCLDQSCSNISHK